uniref:Uncharacterized protein n=1 Tax=Anopheles atroparvus TaxID=41427 RepID=A0A182IUN6_ANOAO
MARHLMEKRDSNSSSQEDIDKKNESLPAAENAVPKTTDGAIDLKEPALKLKRSIPMGRWVHENHAAFTANSDELPSSEETKHD